jgi:predicted small lipoprotein YifL
VNTGWVSTPSSGTRRLALSVLVVPVLVTLAGCGSKGGDDTTPASPSAGVSPSASVSTTPTPSSGTSTSAASPSPAAPRNCATSDLRVTHSGPEGTAGSTFYTLRLTNISGRPCRTGGFGGVSLVHMATGAPVGAPAQRVHKDQAQPMTLKPGRRAEAALQVVQAGNFSAATCRPVAVQGLRIYPPNETRSAFVPLATTGCRSAQVHLLSLSPYRPAG